MVFAASGCDYYDALGIDLFHCEILNTHDGLNSMVDTVA